MSNELQQLLIIIAIALPFGVILGLALRLLYPERAKKYAVYSVTRTWHFWLFGCAMFSVLVVSQIAMGRFWFAGLSSFLLVSQFYNLLQSLGTSTASKQAKLQAIEDWNPRKSWSPFRKTGTSRL